MAGKAAASGALRTYTEKYPHALPEKSRIWGRSEGVWRRALIISCRIAERFRDPRTRLYDRTLLSLDESDYDYYVHWEGYDRRNDAWLTHENIRSEGERLPDNERIEDSPSAQPDHDHEGMDEAWLQEHEENTKVKCVMTMEVGPFRVPTWYYSPLPIGFHGNETLYVCDFCLELFGTKRALERHESRCYLRHPPGDEIYREGNVSMFEVDGFMARIYCENLSYLAKLFLDHKTLKHSVAFFIFYVLCEYVPESGYYRVVGYFSREKGSANNLSCILTFPQHQRKGHGKFLIAFSYALSRREGVKGGPERPLSDLGKSTYMAYWVGELLPAIKELQRDKQPVTLMTLSNKTFLTVADVRLALEGYGILRVFRDKDYLWLPPELETRVLALAGRPARKVHEELLHWTPYNAGALGFAQTSQVFPSALPGGPTGSTGTGHGVGGSFSSQQQQQGGGKTLPPPSPSAGAPSPLPSEYPGGGQMTGAMETGGETGAVPTGAAGTEGNGDVNMNDANVPAAGGGPGPSAHFGTASTPGGSNSATGGQQQGFSLASLLQGQGGTGGGKNGQQQNNPAASAPLNPNAPLF
uniref:Histone acetyltransferase n=1 Tax=Chromera velia CCMP2878 TaxID=1169474 RepID=A0A0G4H416_9ALVE|mmetsp:Transcript_33124/g.65761  ORF Transcript_33124/g.65761 Transcript_33124/m.65761 type:complete len:583 (-) Transcript_33124:236-1984(-)|eukprot:Cvel_24610.t1-p1 / transcript=Cvel_24610.t1 / gene=Cvel_24610 / organism=Chromera_velia_CCMP2878 / gene_product=Putative MYST-like histone acetyltransferase 1, putative / transcript_product=Putative MYST-like histone acetyltransferase 1, putative / location=Cvel_scaffold2682:8408-15606(+) / protein_length=582 / sequence_SO=supercontig / SO=protein_coding / is_pseudo=false